MPPRASLAVLILGLGCGGNVVVDGTSTASSGDVGATATASTASSGSSASSGAGGGCPAGTCTVDGQGGCEVPTGPLGNTCCRCTDGECSARCVCASPDTPIATPTGDRAIAELAPGDLVYTVHDRAVVVAPILATHRSVVDASHRMVRVHFATGAVVDVSGGHPTLDGGTFADLRAGSSLHGVPIVAVETVPYGLELTYDILPASDSGGYFAGGVLIGSTLRPAARVE